MKKIIVAFLLVSFQTSASCSYELTDDQGKIFWTAFKTLKKIGVNGEFKKFKITSSKKVANSISDLIDGAEFEVDTSSVYTGDLGRDKKIVKNFFEVNKKVILIKGQVKNVSTTVGKVLFTIGDSSKEIELKLSERNGVAYVVGEINGLDFNLKKNLDAITAACKALHEGITWPEVKIGIEFKVKKSC